MANSKRTLVILYPGCIEFEVMLAAELLNEHYSVLVATPDGLAHKGSNGMEIAADVAFANVELDSIRVVLVPGGDPGNVFENSELRRILREANRRQLTLGAICAGPILLAGAGVLRGRKMAHGYSPEQLEFLKQHLDQVNVSDHAFEVSGNIVTAKPNAYVDFAIEIALLAGVFQSQERAEMLRSYYKGGSG